MRRLQRLHRLQPLPRCSHQRTSWHTIIVSSQQAADKPRTSETVSGPHQPPGYPQSLGVSFHWRRSRKKWVGVSTHGHRKVPLSIKNQFLSRLVRITIYFPPSKVIQMGRILIRMSRNEDLGGFRWRSFLSWRPQFLQKLVLRVQKSPPREKKIHSAPP